VLKSTWEFISKAQITIKINLFMVGVLWQGDKFLIPTFQEFATANKWLIERMRLAVQAISWAGIVTLDGQGISGRALNGQPKENRRNRIGIYGRKHSPWQ
jgi:hypothetical protein